MQRSDFEISDIKTDELYKVSKDTKINEVKTKMDKYRITYLPVKYNDTVTNYVNRSNLDDASNTDKVRIYDQKINISNIANPSVGFHRTMDLLYENPFYFIGGIEDIDGIVTRSDLNSKPVFNYLYRYLINFENEVENYIENNINKWENLVNNETIKSIEKRWNEDKKKDIDLRKIDYAQFSTKLWVIFNNNESRKDINYENKSSKDIRDINELRNDVAHGNHLIYDFTRDPSVNKRNVTDLNLIIRNISYIKDNLN